MIVILSVCYSVVCFNWFSLKKTFSDDFLPFFGPYFECNFLSHLLRIIVFNTIFKSEEVGPPLLSAEARRKGPLGPELLILQYLCSDPAP